MAFVRRLAGVFLGLALLAIASPSTALAAPPANDNFSSATVIAGLPFSDSVDITEATREPDEPSFCAFSPGTVWYSVTPAADGVIRADPTGSSFSDTELMAYRADGPGLAGLSFLGCAEFGGSLTFSVQAGNTYFLQAGYRFSGGGTLQLSVKAVSPPPNDDFANATPVLALPFSDIVDAAAGTTETGEPTPSCAFGALSGTVWYAFTPAVTGSVSANVGGFTGGGFGFDTAAAAYSGSSLTSLTEVRCNNFIFGGLLTVHVDAGTTVFFQVGGMFGARGFFNVDLAATPPPVASFFFSPSDPSSFDTVQFQDFSSDPGQVGIQSRAWDFGDGTTGAGCCPSHRYATDGDYTVKLDVTTFDERNASTSQVVRVRTHDVAITKFTAPTSASSGQTRQISVGIRNSRYPENVVVHLFKSVAGGFQLVGDLTQAVPVRPSNRTTSFNFNYTFTTDDAAIGKVTFKAVADLIDARDALLADNEAIASPTKVNR